MEQSDTTNAALPAAAKRVFKGILFDVYHWEQEQFDGSFRTFEKLKRNDSSVVIPILENGKFLIAEDAQPGRSTVLTFPGGQGEDGETPLEAAERELLEETGYKAAEMHFLRALQPSSKMDWTIHTFVARGCRKVQEPVLDPGERIIPMEVTLDELIALSDDPRFQSRELQMQLVKSRYDKQVRASLEKLLYG